MYSEGVRVSHTKKQLYFFELIKNKWKKAPNNCFAYECEPCIFYDDPTPLLKSLGYNHVNPIFIQFKRKSKNVTIFKSLKYGLQVILYHSHEKDDSNEEKGKL